MESGDREIYARMSLAAAANVLTAVGAEISGPDGVRARRRLRQWRGGPVRPNPVIRADQRGTVGAGARQRVSTRRPTNRKTGSRAARERGGGPWLPPRPSCPALARRPLTLALGCARDSLPPPRAEGPRQIFGWLFLFLFCGDPPGRSWRMRGTARPRSVKSRSSGGALHS